MAANREDDKSAPQERDPWGDSPAWIRVALQVVVVLAALSVWTVSTLDAISQHKDPNLTTFGLLGLVVVLVYGQQIRKWWRQ